MFVCSILFHCCVTPNSNIIFSTFKEVTLRKKKKKKTDRQTDRQTDGRTKTERDREKQSERARDRQTDRQTETDSQRKKNIYDFYLCSF